ncbi:MAG: MFS transporter [Ottowia sp.]|nr:MFS transporter [Ottowia sp.]
MTQRTQHLLLFPLALVLFEFSTYIGNDMILPGMLAVIHEFNAQVSSVPTAMTAYLLGGAALQWLLGPLSDRIGRRPVLLTGVLLFTLSCLLTLVVNTIEQFFILRVIQGFGLCFITAVGYAAIQETFDETTAVKVTALMANVALIAPLIGPLAGAIFITIAPWRATFIFIAAISLISFFGLYRFMPRHTPVATNLPFSWQSIASDYRAVLTHRRFALGTLAISFASLPTLMWIGQAPVILMVNAGLSPIALGLWQIPVFAALILGNIIVAKLVERYPVEHLVHVGTPLLLVGLLCAWVAMLIAPEQYIWLVIGMTICAAGLGIINAALTRLTLFATPVAKGTVSAVFSMITMLIYTIGVEIVAIGYTWGGNLFFSSMGLCCGFAFLSCVKRFTGHSFVGFCQALLANKGLAHMPNKDDPAKNTRDSVDV